jgi:hypothetical protein
MTAFADGDRPVAPFGAASKVNSVLLGRRTGRLRARRTRPAGQDQIKGVVGERHTTLLLSIA